MGALSYKRDPSGEDTGFQKGGGVMKLLSTKTGPIHANVHDISPLLMKFVGPQRGGGGGFQRHGIFLGA